MHKVESEDNKGNFFQEGFNGWMLLINKFRGKKKEQPQQQPQQSQQPTQQPPQNT